MLTDLYSTVESTIGCYFIIWGVAIILNKSIIESFFRTLENIEENEFLILVMSTVCLILGLVMIWTHNDWHFGRSVIVTLIGWVVTVKSSLSLVFPKQLSRLSKKYSKLILNSWFHFVYGAFVLFLGLVIVWTSHF